MVSRETGFRSAPPARRRVYELPGPRRGPLAVQLVATAVLACDGVLYHELVGAQRWMIVAVVAVGAVLGLVALRAVHARRRSSVRFTLDDRALVIEDLRGERTIRTRSVRRDALRAVELTSDATGYGVALRTTDGMIPFEPPSAAREPAHAVRIELQHFLELV